MTWLVIRVRSDRTVERSIRETMESLNLTRVNHAVLIPESDTYAGMLQKVKDFVTWGEISAEAIAGLIRDRGRLMGDKPITDAAVKEGSELQGHRCICQGDCQRRSNGQGYGGNEACLPPAPTSREQGMGRRQAPLHSRVALLASEAMRSKNSQPE